MSLSPLVNVPITRQDSVIEVVRKTIDGATSDEAFVTTTITVQDDIAEDEVTLILPMTSEMGSQQVIRWVDEPVTESVAFDDVERSVLDEAVVKALADLQESEKKKEQAFLKAIDNASDGLSSTVLKVKPGQRQLRFFYTFKVSAGSGVNTLQVLAPLASFVIQPGGSISVVAVLPAGASVLEAVALQDPANVNSNVPVEQASLGGRPCLGFFWQNDPLFRIRYS